MAAVKTSNLLKDTTINSVTDFILGLDVGDTTQSLSGTTKTWPFSSVQLGTWELSANYHVDLIEPLYNEINTLSANWNTAYDLGNTLAGLSADAQSVFSDVNSNSANWNRAFDLGNTLGGLSANDQSVYSNVNITSANWNRAFDLGNTLGSLSANWNSDYSNTNTNSANWNRAFAMGNTLGGLSANDQSVYSNVNITSANWNRAFAMGNTLGGLSANAQSVYSNVKSTSATFQLIANKGIANGYASLDGNVKVPLAQRTRRTRIDLTPGATIATDASLGDEFDILTNQNFTLSNPTNGYHGQLCVWTVKFGGVHTVSLDSNFRVNTTLSWTSSADRFDKMGAVYNSTANKWDVMSFVPNFPG